jgi:hypothetical protein
MIALNKKFTTDTGLFWPVTLGFVATSTLMVVALAAITKDGFPIFLMFFLAGLVYGSPGYASSFYIFHRARRNETMRRNIIFQGMASGAFIAFGWILLILFPDPNLPLPIVEFPLLFYIVAFHIFAGLACMVITIFFFYLFDRRHDNRH